MVDGPKSPEYMPFLSSSMTYHTLTDSLIAERPHQHREQRPWAPTLRRISGALDPRAISVKFDTVAFHTFTWQLLLYQGAAAGERKHAEVAVMNVCRLVLNTRFFFEVTLRCHMTGCKLCFHKPPRLFDGSHEDVGDDPNTCALRFAALRHAPRGPFSSKTQAHKGPDQAGKVETCALARHDVSSA